MSRYIFKNADFITGISDEAIIWARMKVQQKFNINNDKSFHLAYRNDKNLFIDDSFLSINKIDVKAHHIYCFFGTLSKRIELKTLCEAAHILESRGKKNIRFVICGNGDMYNYIKSKASMCETIVAPGWIGKEQIETLLKISKAGFLPYPSSLDFVRSYPNKVGEYLSAGLPILSSIDGAMSNLLNDWNCGITYKNNSPRSLANAIIQLQKDKSSYELMSKNAKKCFFEKFDSETVYRNYSIFIESKA